jgi:ubiquinone/menaquinone biosynthesis C-methylase UbiE
MFSWYTQHLKPLTAKLYWSLIPFLRLESAQKIAEVGCGPGNGVEILLDNTQDAQIYASDIGDVIPI